jgi:probable rRNA maturation factor
MTLVAVKCEASSARRYARIIRNDARALLKLLSLDNHELSLVLTDDAAIRALNRVFRRKDSATDVLSFPQLEIGSTGAAKCSVRDYGMPAMLGDVVISVDTAQRQAERLGETPQSRLRTLLIHGVLHLLGYDHEKSRSEARRMFARERELAVALVANKHRHAYLSSAAGLVETAGQP